MSSKIGPKTVLKTATVKTATTINHRSEFSDTSNLSLLNRNSNDFNYFLNSFSNVEKKGLKFRMFGLISRT